MTDQPTSVSMRTSDIDEIEAAVLGLPLDLQRLTAKQGSVGFASTACDEVNIFAGEFGFPIVTQGDIAGGYLVVALQLGDGVGHWNGVEFSLDRAWLYWPGSEHFGVGPVGVGAGPPGFATISIPAAHGLCRHVDGSGSATRSSIVVHDSRVRMLRTSVRDVLAAAQSGELTYERAHRAQRDLVEILAALDTDAETTRLNRSAAIRIVQQCIAVADALDPIPTMVDLASAFGVSDRWIRAAFGKVYGVSPSAFCRVRAMNGAHRQLRSARPGSATVTGVAMTWGFWHLGRFSAAYRSFFGELPSETLARAD